MKTLCLGGIAGSGSSKDTPTLARQRANEKSPPWDNIDIMYVRSAPMRNIIGIASATSRPDSQLGVEHQEGSAVMEIVTDGPRRRCKAARNCRQNSRSDFRASKSICKADFRVTKNSRSTFEASSSTCPELRSRLRGSTSIRMTAIKLVSAGTRSGCMRPRTNIFDPCIRTLPARKATLVFFGLMNRRSSGRSQAHRMISGPTFRGRATIGTC